ncbi:MAG: adenylosuccinate synthetase [Candidatus Aenigmarchaeota archaeon]|nr:adenylosuccinate synthetase [Candidatus Aenigmarchaeota archaeon]
MSRNYLASSPWAPHFWDRVGVVAGAQWGDEGKGKFVSDAAPYTDVFVRSQGGPNSGHTVMVNSRKYAFHQVPSGAAFGKPSIMTAGMVLNPILLYEEMQQVDDPSVIVIDPRAAVITRAHRALDGYGEANGTAIGTTRQGMGPAYESKANRRELIVISDLLNRRVLRDKIANYARTHAAELLEISEMEQRAILKGELDPNSALVPSGLNFEQYCELLAGELFEAGKKLAPHIANDTSTILQQAVNDGKRILVEGAQGILLDRDIGTVPYVTSSRTTAGATLADAGLSRYADPDNGFWGVIKAYTTRVGGGPFPTELKDDTGELLRQKGFEFGTTTGRARRTGWFDAVATAYAIRMGEIKKGYFTKMDVLSAVKEPMICVAYEIDGGRTTQFPSDAGTLARAIPVLQPVGRIERMNRHDIVMAGRKNGFDALPENAGFYVDRVETLLRDLSGVKDFEISAVSVGPWKGQTVLKQAFA